MVTDCNPGKIEFQPHGRREVVAKFDGGRMSSDGGALLLRSADMLFDVTGRLAACFTDHRKPERIEHALPVLVAQRVMGIALGYEDINDHDRLRDDSALALAVGCDDLTGDDRARERDRGHPLAGSSTLNRLELGTPEEAETDRYKKIVPDIAAIDQLMVPLTSPRRDFHSLCAACRRADVPSLRSHRPQGSRYEVKGNYGPRISGTVTLCEMTSPT